MVDIHSHLLPGLDDGAADLEASLALLGLYQEQGVTDVVCTPHLPPPGDPDATSYACRIYLDRRDDALDLLRRHAASRFPGIRLHAGAELLLSSGFPRFLEQFAAVSCLAGSRHLLVETPVNLSGSLGAIDRMLFHIQLAGLTPVLAHPERMDLSSAETATLCDWVSQDRLRLQVNAGAFLPPETLPPDKRGGQRRRHATALRLLAEDCVFAVASDTHSPDLRPPVLKKAFGLVAARCGAAVAERLFVFNPRSILEEGNPP